MAVIRRMQKQDIPRMAYVHHTAWMETYTGLLPQAYLDQRTVPDQIRKYTDRFDRIKDDHYVLEENGEIVGLFDLSPAREEAYGCRYEVETLYLLKAAQGRGYGRLIFDHIRAYCRAHGETRWYLWCLDQNPALGFYQHMGGVEVDRKKEVFGQETREVICLLFSCGAR